MREDCWAQAPGSWRAVFLSPGIVLQHPRPKNCLRCRGDVSPLPFVGWGLEQVALGSRWCLMPRAIGTALRNCQLCLAWGSGLAVPAKVLSPAGLFALDVCSLSPVQGVRLLIEGSPNASSHMLQRTPSAPLPPCWRRRAPTSGSSGPPTPSTTCSKGWSSAVCRTSTARASWPCWPRGPGHRHRPSSPRYAKQWRTTLLGRASRHK